MNFAALLSRLKSDCRTLVGSARIRFSGSRRRAWRQALRGAAGTSLRLIEPLRTFRFVWYAAWIARRWQDPAFPDAFPHFGTRQYWETETRDLEEQVERLLRGGDVPEGLRREEAAEPELSNEEIFWDL